MIEQIELSSPLDKLNSLGIFVELCFVDDKKEFLNNQQFTASQSLLKSLNSDRIFVDYKGYSGA